MGSPYNNAVNKCDIEAAFNLQLATIYLSLAASRHFTK